MRPIQLHDIALKLDGSVVRDLEIDEVMDGTRDRGVLPKDLRGSGLGNLVEEGGVRFRTLKTRKTFFLPFSGFSFLVNNVG